MNNLRCLSTSNITFLKSESGCCQWRQYSHWEFDWIGRRFLLPPPLPPQFLSICLFERWDTLCPAVHVKSIVPTVCSTCCVLHCGSSAVESSKNYSQSCYTHNHKGTSFMQKLHGYLEEFVRLFSLHYVPSFFIKRFFFQACGWSLPRKGLLVQQATCLGQWLRYFNIDSVWSKTLPHK